MLYIQEEREPVKGRVLLRLEVGSGRKGAGGEGSCQQGKERTAGSAQLSKSCPHPLNVGCDRR